MRFIKLWSAVTVSLFLISATHLQGTPRLSDSDRDLSLQHAKLEKASGKPVGAYRALIIGINDYKDKRIPDLKTAVNDAREMADVLKRDYGFKEATLLLDSGANGSRIIKELRRLSTQSGRDDSVLIYYAGHGDLDKITKSGWWVPYNATASDPSTYIDNLVIQKYVKAIPARHILVVADSCFSGTLFGEARELPKVIDDKFYASLFKEKSRWGMTSGNLTPVSDSGSQGHSIFAYQFLKTLKENEKSYLTPREIYQKIGPVIRNNSEQMPVTRPIRNTGDEGGEFVFIRTAAVSSLTDVIVEPPAAPQREEPLIIPSPKKKRLYARLEIGTKPMGAKIYINDDFVGNTKGGNLVWDKFPAGEYGIKAQKEGYRDKESRISLYQEGEKIILDLQRDVPEGMVFIEGGCFQMGDQFGDGDDDERPVHEVCLDDFYLGEHEATVGEFREFVNETGYRTDAEKGGGCFYYTGTELKIDENKYWDNPGFSQRENHPVTCVSWNDAAEYIRWKKQKTGLNYRLPTEAEWEYAAREGGKHVRFAGFSREGDLSKYANFCDSNCDFDWKTKNQNDGYKYTSPVKSFRPNSLGLHDMTGNVWEWVSDWYDKDYYRNSPRSNSEGPRSGKYRVLRGGSWSYSPRLVRAANRNRLIPDARYTNGGFRVAQD